MNKYELVTVHLPPEVDAALCAEAKARGMSVSRFAAQCVEALIEEVKARRSPSSLPSAA